VSSERGHAICQTGYLADEHHFYFGETFQEVDGAGRGNDAFKITLQGDENIFEVPHLQVDKVYYWCADAQRGDYVYNF